ncbi:Rab GTPase-activating protein 1 [Eumeta japonica]|uniref:Rab GTPase-activating protein 1 n=1 Tax=Eumeta variegata TaxID=151549 RepID=A0A4C1UPE7_EUMVA|nr:Rab GTPase-activating protein 1 [Eumeta japonica]
MTYGRYSQIVYKETCRLVGGSKFYEVLDDAPSTENSTPSPTEKQDHMKPTESDDEVSDVDQECTMFSGVSYLGTQNITDPKSESEIQRIMKELSAMPESQSGIAVSISIPVCSQGLVVLYEADSNSVMARYAVNRISFYARGAAGSPVASCFAFTWSHGETKESAVYRCHVFRCHIAEAVTQVSTDPTDFVLSKRFVMWQFLCLRILKNSPEQNRHPGDRAL